MVLQADQWRPFPETHQAGPQQPLVQKWSGAVDAAANWGITRSSSMKRVVMPVRWQCAKCRRWYCGNQPCPWCWRHYRSFSCWPSPVSQQVVALSWLIRHSIHIVYNWHYTGVDAHLPVCLHRLNKIQQSLKESYSVQITEALLLVTGLSNTFLVSV